MLLCFTAERMKRLVAWRILEEPKDEQIGLSIASFRGRGRRHRYRRGRKIVN